MHAAFDKGFRHGGYLVDSAIQPERGVDIVRKKVARYAASGHAGIEPPEAFAALRQVARNSPVLQENGSVVEDSAEASFVDQLFRQGDRGNPAIVVPDHVGNTSILDGPNHRFGFRRDASKRLFAQDDLAGFGGCDGDLGVRVVGARDIDKIDVFRIHHASPVGLKRLIAPVRGEGAGFVRVTRADRFEDRLKRQGEEVGSAAKRVRMGAAHEAASDDSDIQGFHARCPESAWSQPCASRTAIIVRRTSFQIFWSSMTELGNMHPSQQICSKARVGFPLSSSIHPAESRTTSSLPSGSSGWQCLPVLSCEPAPFTVPSFCATWKSNVQGRSARATFRYAAAS